MRRIWWLLYLAAMPAWSANLWPDPGYEQTGRVGDAHSGQRAGVLTIGAQAHWLALGGAVKVEPFATYRFSAWVKARYARGQCLAGYVYHWDSYVWAFHGEAKVPSGGDWQRLEVTFRSPDATIELHPLAFLDAANGEALIDDAELVQTATPEQTLASLKAATTATRTPDETRLLARWYVGRGDLAAAKALVDPAGDALANADVACVVGLATREPAQRQACLLEMVRYGAAGYNDGPKRLNEVAAGLEPASLVRALKAAALATPRDKTFVTMLRTLLAKPAGPGTVAERRARLGALQADLAGLADPALTADLARSQAALEADMQQLGKARVLLGGRALSAATHQVVMPDQPTPSEEFAARDLQMHLEKITGEALPLVKAAAADARLSHLFVGRQSATAGVDYAKLGVEGVRILTRDRDLVLTGGQRGVLYAVYVFLEEHLGCRWFTADCATWPTVGTLDVGKLDRTVLPALEYRATDYPCSRPPEFAVRNRLNGNQVEADARWGGKIVYKGFVHTFNSLVPPELYGATHPEYFSEIKGKRVVQTSQLCLTNPDVLRLAIETVRRWLAEAPEATIVSVSQNDWHNYCRCAKCEALAEAEGAQSGPLLHFVNAIADAIGPDHPRVIIDTLAYQYTRKPPLHVKPHKNVAVRLCSIECEFNRPLGTSPFNATFVKDIAGWHAICNRLHIWDYVINYAHSVQPFPNLRVLGPNIKFFIANGVTGLYEEANYYSKGGELAELRTYLMAKLLWNPDYDVDTAISEFTNAYYGPAAPHLRRYLKEIHRLAVSDPAFHMPIYVGPRSPFQTPEAVARYREWFAAAEAAVKADPVRLHRVQVAKLPVLYTQIVQHSAPRYRLAGDTLQPLEGTRVGDLAEEFAAISRAEGLTRVSEGHNGDLASFLGRVGPGPQPQPLVRLTGGLQAVVLPGLGGRLFSLKAGGPELLHVVQDGETLDPTLGGYEEFSTSGYRSPGWWENYTVSQQSATGVTLTAALSNGLRLTRRFEVDATRPELRITSTLLNPSGAAKTACLRVHPGLALTDATAAKLRVGARELSLAEGARQETELWFRDADKPAGEWSLVDAVPGVTLTQQFKPDQVALAYCNWNGPDKRANLELFSPERALNAGQTLVVEQTWTVRTR